MRPLVLLLLAAPLLRADGITDLKAALGRLQGNAPVKGTVEVKSWSRSGTGKEAKDRSGQASAWVEDGPQGLRLQWNRSLMTQMTQESRAKRKDPQAPTPGTLGLGALTPRAVSEQVNACEDLARNLEHAVLESESREAWNGRPARLLTFRLTPNGIPEKERKMIKEFDGTAKVWMEEDGTPLAARTQMKVKGRAFMVISFNQDQEESATFTKVGDRLVCTYSEEKSTSSGTAGDEQRRVVRTFAVQ